MFDRWKFAVVDSASLAPSRLLLLYEWARIDIGLVGVGRSDPQIRFHCHNLFAHLRVQQEL